VLNDPRKRGHSLPADRLAVLKVSFNISRLTAVFQVFHFLVGKMATSPADFCPKNIIGFVSVSISKANCGPEHHNWG
jgi:hypothetical protein